MKIELLKNILLVEDDPLVAGALSRQLANEDREVLCAGSAEEGIRLASERRFQLILTDINLPGMNGLEAIDALKKAGGSPVLVMTGHADEEFALDAKLLGAIGLIAKPFDLAALDSFLSSLPETPGVA